jgi:hypothetical protein
MSVHGNLTALIASDGSTCDPFVAVPAYFGEAIIKASGVENNRRSVSHAVR